MPESRSASEPIIIGGAGIGGLTAALALNRAGHRVLVMERAEALSEVGAGLQLSPNALSVLDDLGVMEDLRPFACVPQSVRIRSARTGSDLARVPLGAAIEARHARPFWVVHRADLQGVLSRAAQAADGIEIRLGAEFEEAETRADGTVRCRFQRPDGQTEDLFSPALIGADGVWSRIRQMVPRHSNPIFSGQVAYRATVPADIVPAGLLNETGLWLGRNAHLVHYPIRSGREFNIVALVTEDWFQETWSAPADRLQLLRRFNDWPVEVRNLLNLPGQWLKWALCGVSAKGPWINGRIALLGDAAHAMLPYMAQGAAMAIEDASVLAALLPAEIANIPAALRNYERLRRPRSAEVQATARNNKRIYHLSGVAAAARDTALRLMPAERLQARFDWIYGWTPKVDAAAS